MQVNLSVSGLSNSRFSHPEQPQDPRSEPGASVMGTGSMMDHRTWLSPPVVLYGVKEMWGWRRLGDMAGLPAA